MQTYYYTDNSREKLRRRGQVGSTEHGQVILVDERKAFVIIEGCLGNERYAPWVDFPDNPYIGDWYEYETVYGEPRDRAVGLRSINHLVG